MVLWAVTTPLIEGRGRKGSLPSTITACQETLLPLSRLEESVQGERSPLIGTALASGDIGWEERLRPRKQPPILFSKELLAAQYFYGVHLSKAWVHSSDP